MVRINHRENLTSPSLNIEDSTYRVVQYETNGSIINTQKLEIYKEYKLDKDLGSAYIKKLYLERINSTIKGFYMITGTSNRSFLNVTINYTVALSGYKKIIKQFKQHIITNNYKDLLKWNITWNEFLLLINKSSGYSNADSVYEEKGQCHEYRVT
ncbi:MAG: hypothetical protein B6U89_06830 [Desulfurococcales archaeon ex4484_58]|nr:MAG: hypothetical protein B6U89_06830 [Desulfurococcales archaeon ex4484_58]